MSILVKRKFYKGIILAILFIIIGLFTYSLINVLNQIKLMSSHEDLNSDSVNFNIKDYESLKKK